MTVVATSSGPVELTEKQFEALRAAARHLNTKQIARELDISPRTVQAHLDAARQRLGVATRTEAIQLLLDTPSRTTCSPERMSPYPRSQSEQFSPLGEIEFHDAYPFKDTAPWEDRSERLPEFNPSRLSKSMRLLAILAIATMAMMLFGSGLMVVDVLADWRG